MKIHILFLFYITFVCNCFANQGQIRPTLSDWGGTGLLNLPNARFHDDGHIAFAPTYVYPHMLFNVNLQFLPWMETSFRYVVSDDKFGKKARHFDRNLDFKFLLLSEGQYRPQIALGFRDAIGTPQFRSEYLVFSKRYFDLDFTAGLGWGRLGSREDVKNIFNWHGHKFDRASISKTHSSGLPGFHDFFRGRHMGIFGGVEYATSIDGLNLKAEYNSDKMVEERGHRHYRYHTPFNFGASYRAFDWLEMRAGIEQGRQIMLGAALLTNFNQRPVMVPEVVPPVRLRGTPMQAPANMQAFERQAAEILKKAGFKLHSIALTPPMLVVYLENKQYRLPERAAGRVARILTHLAPDNVAYFKIMFMEKGLKVSAVTLMRHDLENLGVGKGSAEEVFAHAQIGSAKSNNTPNLFTPEFKTYVIPRFKQTLFEPGKGMRFQVIGAAGMQAEMRPGLLSSAEIGVNLINHLDDLQKENTSKLAHVRSDIKKYSTEGRYHLAHFQVDKVKQLAPDLFGRLSAGFFETMYAGVGGELLYRPFKLPFAVGMDVNHVRQRHYHQLLGFRNYEVTTGHASLYCDTPLWDLQTNLHVGRYLAKDWGGTLEIIRRFETGVEVGFFTTHTNVPHHVFGEGSFDKGIWFKIPLEWVLGGHYRQHFDYMMRPLSKDGGQRLQMNNRLYPMVANHSSAHYKRHFGHFAD